MFKYDPNVCYYPHVLLCIHKNVIRVQTKADLQEYFSLLMKLQPQVVFTSNILLTALIRLLENISIVISVCNIMLTHCTHIDYGSLLFRYLTVWCRLQQTKIGHPRQWFLTLTKIGPET